MANANRFSGLARGPIDHDASSVINAIANDAIQMGNAIKLVSPLAAGETLPRVTSTDSQGESSYGIVVGGDADGVYNDGSDDTSPISAAATGAGQGVVVVTQGRCLARVKDSVSINTPLTPSATTGVLEAATTGDFIVARALEGVAGSDQDVVAIDVQREGVAP